MIVKRAWLPRTKILTVRDSMDPSDPTAGKVTFAATEHDASSDDEKRDFDQERSTQAVKFDVPDKKKEEQRALEEEREPAAEVTSDLRMFLLSAALCNLATVRYDERDTKWQTTGEPTEIALQVFAHRFHRGKKSLVQAGWKQIAEFPFDSTIKRMSVVYNATGGAVKDDITAENSYIFTKGAVERILDLCSHVGVGDAQEEISEELKQRVMDQMSEFASQGQRVLALAYKPWDGLYSEQGDPESSLAEGEDPLRASVEKNLILLGLAGIYDPPRRETTPAIAECSSAGIKVHMLTGDHPETARAIAKEVGIIPHNLGVLPAAVANSVVVKATDFDKLTDAEIDALEELPLVIARCAPETKTRMIEALRRRNAFMAMTGDGVNDAPSLSRADVGIAMGSGSDVAKSAAKIVLTDDKFNSIVAAIREGRRMFDNIQKFILHLLSSNVGEVILLIAGLGFRDESGYSVFPISPLEILWINMLTSSFPAFGLGREKASRDVMRKPPHDKHRGVFTNQILVDMLVYGVLMGVCTLMTFVLVVYGANGGHLGHDCNREYSLSCEAVFRARAAVFAELTWLILVSAWEFKSIRRSMFRLNPDEAARFPLFKDLYENRFLFWAVVLGAISVFPVVYIPVLNTNVFKHTAITWEWGVVVGMTAIYVVGMEIWKEIKRSWNILDDHPVDRRGWSQGSEAADRKFVRSMTMGSFRSWRSWGKPESRGRTNTNTSR
jgi:potassium/sodium efflux P-type ATPase